MFCFRCWCRGRDPGGAQHVWRGAQEDLHDGQQFGVGDDRGGVRIGWGVAAGEPVPALEPAVGQCGVVVVLPDADDLFRVVVRAGDVAGLVAGYPALVPPLGADDLGDDFQVDVVQAAVPDPVLQAEVVLRAAAQQHRLFDVLGRRAVRASPHQMAAVAGRVAGGRSGQCGQGRLKAGQGPPCQHGDPAGGRLRPAAPVVGGRGERPDVAGLDACEVEQVRDRDAVGVAEPGQERADRLGRERPDADGQGSQAGGVRHRSCRCCGGCGGWRRRPGPRRRRRASAW